jgi:hypothetical protein
MSRFRKGKKAYRKSLIIDWADQYGGEQFASVMSGKEWKLRNRYIDFKDKVSRGEIITKNGPMRIVGMWRDDLIWCPSQCYLRFTYRHRWFIIYLRWRHSDPWRAYLCETTPGNVDRLDAYGCGWDMHDPSFEWIPIPVEDFTDKQLDELKENVVDEVKALLLKI